MSQIAPRIWISGKKEALSKRWLKKNNITHVLNCAFEVNYLPSEGIFYAKIYLDDALDQNIVNSAEAAADYINSSLNSDGIILVHCAAGISRSVSMVIAFLIKYHGMTYQTAYNMIQRKRKIAYPNPSFKTQLQFLQTKYHK